MAYINADAHQHVSGRGSIARFFDAILVGLCAAAESNSRLTEARRLQAMTDEELAKKGLKRENIAHHVFSDMFYI